VALSANTDSAKLRTKQKAHDNCKELDACITAAITTFLTRGLYAHTLTDEELLVAVRGAPAPLPCILSHRTIDIFHRLLAVAGTFVHLEYEHMY
jgi:hypothetical protein